MIKKKINQGIVTYQKQYKESTLKKVQEAIDEILADGAVVTKKRLIELTGLSNATFSKNHVKELLKANRVCSFKYLSEDTTTSQKNQYLTLSNQLHHFAKQVKCDEIRINTLKSDIEVKKLRIQQLQDENLSLKHDLSILRGMHHSIIQALQMRGIEIDTGYDRIL